MRARQVLPLLAAVTCVVAVPAAAGAAVDVEVIASGLDNPRHVAISTSGDIYVAEAGRGGDPATSKSCFDSAEGPACTGATGRGDADRAALRRPGAHRHRPGLLRAGHRRQRDRAARDLRRAARVFVTNGGPTGPTRGTPPDSSCATRRSSRRSRSRALFGRCSSCGTTGDVRSIADIWRFERDNNADAQVGNPLIDCNASTCWPTAGACSWPTPAATRCCAARPADGSPCSALFPNVDTPGPGGATIPMQAVPTGVVQGPDGALLRRPAHRLPVPGRRRQGRSASIRTPASARTTRPASRTSSTWTSGATGRSTCWRSTATRSSARATTAACWTVPPGRRDAASHRAAGGHADRAGRARGRVEGPAVRVQPRPRGRGRRRCWRSTWTTSGPARKYVRNH